MHSLQGVQIVSSVFVTSSTLPPIHFSRWLRVAVSVLIDLILHECAEKAFLSEAVTLNLNGRRWGLVRGYQTSARKPRGLHTHPLFVAPVLNTQMELIR